MWRSVVVGMALSLAAAFPAGVLAQGRTLGFEDNSCQAWVKSRDESDVRREYVSWARGFLSGHNYANQKQQISDVSRSTIEMFIERYCRDKPTGQFTDAVYRMSDQYAGRSGPIAK